MTDLPKRRRFSKSILLAMPAKLISAVDAEVRRRQKQGDMVTRSSVIREAVLRASLDWHA